MELEAVLLAHPQVADVAVIRSPDQEAGEIPKAFVVANGPVDAEALMAWVAERVAPYKRSGGSSSWTRSPKDPMARSFAISCSSGTGRLAEASLPSPTLVPRRVRATKR